MNNDLLLGPRVSKFSLLLFQTFFYRMLVLLTSNGEHGWYEAKRSELTKFSIHSIGHNLIRADI